MPNSFPHSQCTFCVCIHFCACVWVCMFSTLLHYTCACACACTQYMNTVGNSCNAWGGLFFLLCTCSACRACLSPWVILHSTLLIVCSADVRVVFNLPFFLSSDGHRDRGEWVPGPGDHGLWTAHWWAHTHPHTHTHTHTCGHILLYMYVYIICIQYKICTVYCLLYIPLYTLVTILWRTSPSQTTWKVVMTTLLS